MGHTFGVRVDGASPRGLWPPAGGGLCKRVVEKGFLRWTGPMGRRVRKFDGAFGPEGCGIALWAMSIIMPPFGGHVHIEYHNHSYPRTSLRHFVALFP